MAVYLRGKFFSLKNSDTTLAMALVGPLNARFSVLEISLVGKFLGEVRERFNRHAWRACDPQGPRVRIPPSPPYILRKLLSNRTIPAIPF